MVQLLFRFHVQSSSVGKYYSRLHAIYLIYREVIINVFTLANLLQSPKKNNRFLEENNSEIVRQAARSI